MSEYTVNESPKEPWGMIVNIPLNGAGAGMNFTMIHLESAMEEMRQAGVPSDANLKVWYDQDCHDLGLPIGPAMRIRAMWMKEKE